MSYFHISEYRIHHITIFMNEVVVFDKISNCLQNVQL